jgi:hypothetical protein
VKRSTTVAAPLVVSVALVLLAGCHEKEMQRCIDQGNAVVDDELCQSSGQQGIYPSYRYYYGGGGSNDLGTLASGGSFSPVPGHTYEVANAATERGGFGSTLWIVVGVAAVMVVGAGG